MKFPLPEEGTILEWKRRLVFWSGAVSVGLAAILFAVACEWADGVFHKLLVISPYLPLLITPVGIALIVYLTRKYFPGAQGSGIPQVIASLDPTESSKVREQVLSLRVMFGKIALTVVGLMCGTAVGREGPTVQIGASIMHKLGSLARFPKHDLEKGLILAGAAAGVAAAFNAPLAGIVFAIEEMSRSFEEHNSTTILMTVIIAGIASLAVLGNYSYFGHTSESMGFGKEWYVVVLCGIVGGLLGGIFSRILIEVNKKGLNGRIGAWIHEKPVAFAAVCGLLLVVVGLVSGNNTYGSGYIEAKTLVDGNSILPESYGLLKMLATGDYCHQRNPGRDHGADTFRGCGIRFQYCTLLSLCTRWRDDHTRHGRILHRRHPDADHCFRHCHGNDRQPRDGIAADGCRIYCQSLLAAGVPDTDIPLVVRKFHLQAATAQEGCRDPDRVHSTRI